MGCQKYVSRSFLYIDVVGSGALTFIAKTEISTLHLNRPLLPYDRLSSWEQRLSSLVEPLLPRLHLLILLSWLSS